MLSTVTPLGEVKVMAAPVLFSVSGTLVRLFGGKLVVLMLLFLPFSFKVQPLELTVAFP